MSENHGPLVPHSERHNVWVRDDDYLQIGARVQSLRDDVPGVPERSGYRGREGTVTYVNGGAPVVRWDGDSIGWAWPRSDLTPPGEQFAPPSFFELVLTWVGIFLSGWLSFLVAHAAMQLALRTVGLQRSALIAAGLGAISGAVAWLAGRRRP